MPSCNKITENDTAVPTGDVFSCYERGTLLRSDVTDIYGIRTTNGLTFLGDGSVAVASDAHMHGKWLPVKSLTITRK